MTRILGMQKARQGISRESGAWPGFSVSLYVEAAASVKAELMSHRFKECTRFLRVKNLIGPHEGHQIFGF